MTTARQIIGMIRSHAVGDNERFLSIAEEIANEALRAGKNRVGEDIHNLLANVRANPRENSTQLQPTPLAKPRGELANLLKVTYPETRLADLVLNAELRRKIERIVREQREAPAPQAHGIAPRKRFIFSGPPGTRSDERGVGKEGVSTG